MAGVDERVRRCYFYVILIISMISLSMDYYNNYSHFKNIHFYVTLYRSNLYCVTIITYCIW